MNKVLAKKIILLGAILLWSLANVHGQLSLNPSSQNFTWYTNNHFQLSEDEGNFRFEMNKNPWEAFTLFLGGVDLSNLPVLEFKIKSDAAIDLRIDMIDDSGENLIVNPLIKTISSNGTFVELSYDFSLIQKELNATHISHLLFYVAPGEKHQGVIELKDITFKPRKHKVQSEKDQVEIASNLNRNEITIHSQIQEFDQVKIYNSLGHLVFVQKIPPTHSKTLNVEYLEQGIFFLEIKKQNDLFHIGSIIR